MEVSETSFKNIHIHNLVKSLTLIPIAALSYASLRYSDLVYILFVVIIMLIYYFIYDLITKKNITNIILTSIYFLITIATITTICSLIDSDNSRSTILNYTDIKEVAIDLKHEAGILNEQRIYTNNQEIVNLIVKSMISDYDNPELYLDVYIKTTDDQEFNSGISISKETYDKLIKLLETEPDYIATYKDINFNEVYALKLGSQIYNKEKAKNYIELIKTILDKLTFQEYLALQDKYQYQSGEYDITLYTYENHNKQSITFSAYIDYELLNTVVNNNNNTLKDSIPLIIPNDYYLYYENAYLEENYNMDFYVIRSAKNEIYNFILQNIEDEVDMREYYITFSVELNSHTYYFTTNKTKEIISILTKKYEEVKDSIDYQKFNGIYTEKENIEYYD